MFTFSCSKGIKEEYAIAVVVVLETDLPLLNVSVPYTF